MNPAAESLRRSVAAVLIAVAIGAAVGHVLTVERVYEPSLTRAAGEESSPYPPWPATRPRPTPLLRSNDRSRWATIRALVDEGTYVVGRRDPAKVTADNTYGDTGIIFEDGWMSVDKVLRPKTQEFYSSKPPLLPTVLAGEYWLLKHGLGWSLADDGQRWWVVRLILVTLNVLPLAVYLCLLARLTERWGATDWGQLYVLAAACFGTFVTAFVGTLNNHVIATCCVLFALAPALRVLFGQPEEDTAWRYAVAGFFASFAACNELPATAFAAALLGMLLIHSPSKTFLCFVPAALVPAAGFFLCNYLALGQFALAYSEFGGPWYEYPGSIWEVAADPARRRGIDWSSEQETFGTYLFHFFVGHHGIFSLSPMWLFAVAGMVGSLALRRDAATAPRTIWQRWGEQRTLAALTLLLTAVVVAFYLTRSRWNYGGWTVGPRWLMWLMPLWLLAMLPAVDRLGRNRLGRLVALIFLGLSVLSAVVPAGSPWHHPWIYWVLEQGGAKWY